MSEVQVFDPAMCCSTGVCGPSPDVDLVRFAVDADWLRASGVEVTRFTISQEPGRFAENPAVRALLETSGESALPIVIVDDEVRSSGRYPERDELAEWTGVGDVPLVVTDAVVRELAAIGAAIAANCEPCLTYHVAQARREGIGSAHLVEAIRAAQAVKDTPARSVLETASRVLAVEPSAFFGAPDSLASESAPETTDDAACGDGCDCVSPAAAQPVALSSTTPGCC
jgi:AhpD family alkylhydroperoxidase